MKKRKNGVKRNLEELLKKANENQKGYEALIQSTDDGIYHVNLNGDYLFANNAYLGRKDKKLEDVVGVNYANFHTNESSQEFFKRINEVVEQKSSITYEEIDPFGTYILRTVSPVFSGEEVSSVMIVAKNITELKHTQIELNEKSKFFQTAVDAIPLDFKIINSEDYVVEFANKAAEINKDDISVKKCYTLNYNLKSACNSESLICPIDIIKKTKKSFTTEHVYHDNHGEKKIINIMASPIIDKTGEVTKIIEISQDITIERKNEEILRSSQKKESLDILAGGIAHDFNNILTSIIGYISIAQLKIERTDESVQQFIGLDHLAKAQELCEKASGTIGQIRGLYETDNSNLNLINFDLYDLVLDIFNILKKHPIEKNSSVIKEINFEKNNYFMNADYSKIRTAIYNLGLNSLDAIQKKEGVKGKISVSISDNDIPTQISEMIHKEDYLHIKFKDNGSGIKKDFIDKIFEPYFSTKEKDSNPGQGLGLSITQSIISNHKGFIEVESRSGQGTTINIYLPKSEKIVKNKLERNYDSLLEKTILVIDDESCIREITKDVLELFNYKCIAAKDGFEGINLYKKHLNEISLVVLDMTMPGMNGSVVLEKILELNSDAKVLMSSGHSNIGSEIKGHIGVLNKPYQPKELISKIEDILQNKY